MASDNLDPDDPERPRGILSKRERRYLLGEAEIEPKSASERSIRQSIRKHLTHTILDFSVVYREMQTRDITTVFESSDESNNKRGRPKKSVEYSAPDLNAFLYRVYGSEYKLERLVKNGIEREAHERGDPVHAEVSIDLFPDEVAEIEHRFDDHGVEAVSHKDLRELWEDDRLTDDEFISYMEKWAERWETDYENRYEYPGGVLHADPVERAKQLVRRNQRGRERTREKLEELSADLKQFKDEFGLGEDDEIPPELYKTFREWRDE